MKHSYLLTCNCGRQVEVDTTQAGLSIRCKCGTSLDVPTMRDLVRLPRAGGEVQAAAQSSWGPRQGMALLGGLIAVAGLAWAVWQWRTTPSDLFVRADQVHEQVAAMTPAQLMEQWEGASDGLDPLDLPQIQAYRALQTAHRRWIYVAAAVALAGLAISISSWMALGPRPAAKRRPRP